MVQVNGDGPDYGVRGTATAANGRGVIGLNNTGDSGVGVLGQSTRLGGRGVQGRGFPGIGVEGFGQNHFGVSGVSGTFIGVYGEANANSQSGVLGITNNRTAFGVSGTNLAGGFAGYFTGNVHVTGRLTKGSSFFKIDHPLDPENRYLYHSAVESADMKNLYDGVVTLDDKGEAAIELPQWFGALNKDFRYQLTAVGARGPDLHIAEEISEANTDYSHFKIAGGTSGMKVSWQVTGVRKDPWANVHRMEVEEDKPDNERGKYIQPEIYGQPAEKSISRLNFPTGERYKPPEISIET